MSSSGLEYNRKEAVKAFSEDRLRRQNELEQLEAEKEEMDRQAYNQLKIDKEVYESTKYNGRYSTLSGYSSNSDEDDEYGENTRKLVSICVEYCCIETAQYGKPGGFRERCPMHRLSDDEYIKSIRKRIKQIVYPPGYNSSSEEETEEFLQDEINELETPSLDRRNGVEKKADDISEDPGTQREHFLEKLRLHKLKHKCPIHLCKARFRSVKALTDHINVHNGIKPHPCVYDWCDYRSTTILGVRQHVKSSHSRSGYIRKLTEESRILRRLRTWGLSVDTDVTIDASRNGCLNDTDRSYSRVDMVILNITSCILILEVDEFAHESPNYNLPCELSRMGDINAFLRLNSYTNPIYWLRYNPNGKYFVGDKEKIVSREKREGSLKRKIFSMMEPDFVPAGNENIFYMFYSRGSEDGAPKILDNPQFPEYVKNIVSWGGIV